MNPRIFALGDTHNHSTTLELICDNYADKILKKGDVIFHVGDAGIICVTKKEVAAYYSLLHREMLKRGLTLHIVRGNHDNPFFFHDHHNWSENVTLCRDHLLIEEGSTLIRCVGGAASVDRMYRKAGFDWYPEELPVLPDIEAGPNPCDIVIAHSVPTFARHRVNHLQPENTFISKLLAEPVVQLDIKKEGEILDATWAKYCPKLWVAGHYHFAVDITEKGTRFVVLDVEELRLISQFLNDDTP